MMITDACVRPYPAGDSSVRRFAIEACSMGYDSIVADGVPGATLHGITVIPGAFISGKPAKDVQGIAKKHRGSGTVVSVWMGDNGFNRAVAGTAGVHILRGIGAADKRAFDHVAAKIAADNLTAIDINLSPLIFGRGRARQKAIHRYQDLMVLQRRFGFPVTLSSAARSVLGLRAVREVTGLCSLLGMDEQDVQSAFAGVETVTRKHEPDVRVIL